MSFLPFILKEQIYTLILKFYLVAGYYGVGDGVEGEAGNGFYSEFGCNIFSVCEDGIEADA